MGTWPVLFQTMSGTEKKIIIEDTVVLNANLLSVSYLQRLGIKTDFDNRVLTAFDNFYRLLTIVKNF